MGNTRFVGVITAALMLAAPIAAHADGRVNRMRIDPHGHVSGFILDDGTEYVAPGAATDSIRRNVHVGDMLHVDTGPNNTLAIEDVRSHRFIDLGAVDTVARGGGPASAAGVAVQYPRVDNAASLQSLVVVGRIAMLTHNPNGDLTGFVMDNGTQIHTVPGIEGLFNDLRAGQNVRVQGRGTRTAEGDAMWAMQIADRNGRVVLDMMRGIGAPELGMGR